MTSTTGQDQKGTLEFQHEKKGAAPVECLGLTFENEQARREHFLALLKEMLRDPEFRKIPGFPQGSDEAIPQMSDPPYYTACPNLFLEDFVRCYGKPYDPNEVYEREQFAVDMSAGKNGSAFQLHSYHTKIPYLAIATTILHYTKSGDLVLDGFCGSDMTGMACQWCGLAPDDQHAEQSPRWTKDMQEEYGPAAILPNLTISQERSLLVWLSWHFVRMTSLLTLPDQNRRWIPTTKKLLNGASSMNVLYTSSNEDKRQPSMTKGRGWT